MSELLFQQLETERLQFMKLCLEDYEAVHEYASDEEVSRFIGWPLTHTLEETKSYVEELIAKVRAETHIYANVIEKSTGVIIGTIVLFNFDKVANKCEIGYVFRQDSWGKGYGREAIKAACDYGFEALKLHKIYAQVFHVNIASAKVLEYNGFTKEGQLKDHYYNEDKFYDCILLGKINEIV